MFKLAKYEYRRNISGIVIMVLMILGFEGYFLIAAQMKNIDHTMTAAALLFFGSLLCVLGVLVYSVGLYGRELNAKTSYLTFMTPNSPAVILGAKLLSTLLLGIVIAGLLVGFAVIDLNMLTRLFPELNLAEIMLNNVLAQADMSVSKLVLMICGFGLGFLINFFTTVLLAYLAITLSATLLQNRKLKGFVSFVLFIAIEIGLNWSLTFLPIDYMRVNSMSEMLSAALPIYLIELAVMAVSFIASACLLKRKVSL